MKRCPTCHTTYPDDANFCPMDAGRLEPVVDAPPAPPVQTQNLVGGRFQVGSPIGGHRTGQVYTGTDLTTGREVALKFIAPQVFPTQLVAQRAERELKQLQKVMSDRVALVLDVGRQADRLWVATELCPGTTLAELIYANGPLPPEHAVRLVLEAGEALAEAAKLGVIHRDVSPKNVLVLPDGKVKVLNFGIPAPLTERVQGIPEFLSPEQAEGKPVDQRSNIYSLGALLTFMLTGQTLFSGDVDSVLKQQVGTPPLPPSARGFAVHPEVERILLKALEKSSSRRHLTLRQLLSELEATLAPVATLMAARPSAPAAPPGARTILGTSVPGPAAAETMMGVQAPRQPTPLEVSAHGSIQPPVQPKTQVMPPVAPQGPVPQSPTQLAAPVPPAPQRTVVAPPAMAQPSPYAPTQPAVPTTSPAAAAPPPTTGKGKNRQSKEKGTFRETMWFKKGELDEAVAAAAEDEPMAPAQADSLPIEDRYKDDSTLTTADRERLSLRTGGTASHPAIPIAKPARTMGEDDLAKELGAGRGRMVLYILLAVVVVAAVVLYFGVFRK